MHEEKNLTPESEAKPEPAAEETPKPETVEETPTAEATEDTPSAEPTADVTEAESEGEPEAVAPEGPKRSWYVVHCYSGYENKVKKGLEQRINSMGMQNLIFRAVVPTEEEVDIREGKRKVIPRRVFPGYILVEMVMTEESWYVVRNTPGVTGFVSSGDKPQPLREEDVAKILKRMETDQPKVRVTYRPGQAVRIIDGPFADFRGTVEEVNMEKGKVRVLVSMFGRETPLELDLLQVEKV
ncbi:MAG: transcription termination/antitermination protein NusG [Chloroflexi bacterium]|nr:transcription termination/antitermination protein NusG [Chloroflexota bacterium]